MNPGDTGSHLDLDLRSGLPDALRVLLDEFPRENWEEHPGFDGLIRFWLDRHMMFRRILEKLTVDANQRMEGAIDPIAFSNGLTRLGSAFVGELHMHHNIEDAHYFPVLSMRDQRLASGFDLLDRDHHELEAQLHSFTESANAALRAGEKGNTEVGRLVQTLAGFEKFLDRHLIDEEELVVPVILKHGTAGLG